MLLTEYTSPCEVKGSALSTTSSADTQSTWLSGPGVRRSHTRSVSSVTSASSNPPLRLADVAKQHGMGIHVENWREDMNPVRQYLPLQHIIGSLKRDRDQQVRFYSPPADESFCKTRRQTNVAAVSPRSEDSFAQMLRTPKRRRLSDGSAANSTCTTDTDPDRRFSWQAAEHVSKDIPQSALPGLNHVLNLATITAGERDIFTEYAPKHLEDPQILMNEVLQLREEMMNDQEAAEDDEQSDCASEIGSWSSVVPPERDAEVRKAFEEFVDLNRNKRFVAKI